MHHFQKDSIIYDNVLLLVLDVLNSHDPMDLSPGKTDGAPADEYQQEAALLASFLISNKDNLTLENVEAEVNRIWKEYFDSPCCKARDLAKNLILMYRDVQN